MTKQRDDRGVRVNVYLTAARRDFLATLAGTPGKGLMKLVDDAMGKPAPKPLIPASALPVGENRACRSCRVNGKPYNPRCKTCVAVGEE